MMPSPNASQKSIDVMEVGEVTIRFKINFDARSWGIKGARIEIVPNKLLIEVVILESTDTRDDQYVKTIQFDTSGIELFQKQGSEITITNLVLYINDNFSINYKKSMFEGTTMMGN
jgi:hypothetical protein